MKYKNILFYLFFLLVFTVAIFEILVRFFPIYEKFGWKLKHPLFDRVENIDNPSDKMINNFVIGDSLVEYMKDDKANFVNIVEKKLNNQNQIYNFHNLGFAGTGPRDYLMIMNYIISKNLKIDNLYIFIDNSTDFSDYFYDIENNKTYTNEWKEPEIYNLDIENVNFKNFVKQSVIINLIYRYFFKQYLKVGYGNSLDKNINDLSKIFEIDEKKKNQKINSIDQKYIKLSKSDIINSFWVAGGILFPEMKKFEKFGYPLHSEAILANMKKDFEAINLNCENYIINCHIIFIPDQTSVDEKYQPFYKDLGFEIENSFLDGISFYEDFLINNFNNSKLKFHKLHGKINSSENMYLFLDNHFNFEGNKKMADAFYNIIKSN